MPTVYLSDTKRVRVVGGLAVVEYYDVGTDTWIAEKKPATIQLWPENASVPGFGGDYPEPCGVSSYYGTNFPYMYLEFDKDTEEHAWWHFALPPNFDPTKNIKVSIFWIAETLIVGDVVWGASVLGREECEAWDDALGTEVEITDTTHGTIKSVVKTEITLTPTEHALAANDAVVLELARKAAADCDSLDEDADVVMVKLDIPIDPAILIESMP
ncbi:hypothetical protein ES703_23074 [subsurface metagenome]